MTSPIAPATEHERARALAAVRRHGWNASSFQIVAPGFRYWFDDGTDDACVAFADTGGAWVVAGAPIAADDQLATVTRRFLEAARANGRRVCFFGVEPRFCAAAAPMRSLQVGEQPVWDPRTWTATLGTSKSLREQLRRARAKSVKVRVPTRDEIADRESPVRRAIAALIARWLDSRAMAPMGFLVDLAPFEFAHERRYYVAERDGRLVGFLAAVPVFARNGWFFEDLLRDPNAPNGTAELLVDAAMNEAAAGGAEYVTLGLAPLAGEISPWLRKARDWSARLYDFRGVHGFKSKLRPNAWDPIYLACPPDVRTPLALYDALEAFARGSLSRFGIETILRGPIVVVETLTVLLVPWTAMLALANTARWFPSRAVQIGWVLFDVVLTVALFALSRRWRMWLATALAIAITSDAALTFVEAMWFNVPRVRSPGDAMVLATACLAPAFAAVVLWGARATRSRQARAGLAG